MPLRMPAEHGAWGIWTVPLLSAALVGGAWNVPLLLYAVCALGLFLLRGSVEAQGGWREIRQPAHLALAALIAACGAALLVYYQRVELAWVLAGGLVIYAAQEMIVRRHAGARGEERTEKRSLAAELVGVVLLSLAAPAAWIAARGRMDRQAVAVWLLNVLFFLGGVLYVKYRVRGLLSHRKFDSWGERLAFAWPVFVYHTLLLVFLAGWIWVADATVMLAIAFLPAVLRANGLVFQLGERFPIKRLGWMEMAQSVAFLALLVLAFR